MPKPTHLIYFNIDVKTASRPIGQFIIYDGVSRPRRISFLSYDGAMVILAELIETEIISRNRADTLLAQIYNSVLERRCSTDLVGGLDMLAALIDGLSERTLHKSKELCRNPALN